MVKGSAKMAGNLIIGGTGVALVLIFAALMKMASEDGDKHGK